MATVAPNIHNYAEYVASRIARTLIFMEKFDIITGRQVLDNNLSIALICRSGYTFNPFLDQLERTSVQQEEGTSNGE